MPRKMKRVEFDANEVVLPLFGVDKNNKSKKFLGTGFFVGDESIFVTAAHNVFSDQKYSVLNTIDLHAYYNANIVNINEKM